MADDVIDDRDLIEDAMTDTVDEFAHSPTLRPVVAAMDFPEAIREVIDGKRITRKEWANATIVLLLADGRLKIRKGDRSLHDLIVSDGDLLATDWIVVREY